jgi:hypothetical protein
MYKSFLISHLSKPPQAHKIVNMGHPPFINPMYLLSCHNGQLYIGLTFLVVFSFGWVEHEMRKLGHVYINSHKNYHFTMHAM